MRILAALIFAFVVSTKIAEAQCGWILWQKAVKDSKMTDASPTWIGYTYTSGNEPQMIPGTLVSSGFFEA